MSRLCCLSKLMAIFGICSASMWSGASAAAVEFKTGEQVEITSQQVIEDDLYMAGDTLTVSGRVEGDVVAWGRIVRINGVVEGDLIAAGQMIEISGQVLDDVRVAGMTLRVNVGSSVGDDVIAAGFSFESLPGSEIGGETRLMGFQGAIGGEHLEGLEASVIGLLISGTVKGDVDATVDSEAGPAWWSGFMQSPEPLPTVEPGLHLTSGATIGGNLSYRSTRQAVIGDGATIVGDTRHEEKALEPPARITVGQRLISAFRWLVVLLLLGATVLWLVPDKMVGVAGTMVERPIASLGWGLVTLLGFPVAMILVVVLSLALTMAFGLMTLGNAVALVLVVGAVILILLAAKLWVGVVYLAPVVASFAGGGWLLTRRGETERSRYLSLLVGLAILAVLSLIPLVGNALRWLVTLIGLGAAALWSVRHLASTQAVED